MEISIITASYNCQDTIKETLDSVLSQTYKNWRLIVFDDGSKDSSLDIIRRYAQSDGRIQLLRHPGGANKGLPQTLQKALACVKTEYAAFLECDDILDKDYLKEKVDYIRNNPGAEIIYSKVKCFGDKNRVKKLTLFNKAAELYVKMLNPFSNKYNLNFPLLSFNPVPTFSCVMLKTALAEEYGFDSPYPPQADYWLWARLSFKHKFHFIGKDLTLWRLTQNSYTMKSLGNAAGEKRLRDAIKDLYIKNNPASYLFKAGLSKLLSFAFKLISFIFKPVAKIILGINKQA